MEKIFLDHASSVGLHVSSLHAATHSALSCVSEALWTGVSTMPPFALVAGRRAGPGVQNVEDISSHAGVSLSGDQHSWDMAST